MSDVFLKYLLEQGENEWIEFKESKSITNTEIGEYISALANSATLCGVQRAYLIFGITDAEHKVVGTTFEPKTTKVGNEELEKWLLKCLNKEANFIIHIEKHKNKKVVIFEISPAKLLPVQFKSKGFIRIGSNKQSLKEFPQKERELWRALLQDSCFENQIAKPNVSIDEISSLLDIKVCCHCLKLPKSKDAKSILSNLIEYELVVAQNATLNITNLGAILFARNLNSFSALANKQARIIKYKGKNKSNIMLNKEISSGYVVGFDKCVKLIIENFCNNSKSLNVIIKELLINALIHQDFTINGNPMIEIYDNRIEISNSGESLVDIMRLIDYLPKSRNAKLARLMRLMGMCNEVGCGIDKIVDCAESSRLPALKFETDNKHFKAIIYTDIAFKNMDMEDKIRAIYQCACLKYTQGDFISETNARKRFGIDDKQATKIIDNALKMGLLKQMQDKPKRFAPYFV